MLRVGLVQINNEFSGQCYLPLSVGMLQAYAQKYLTHPEHYEFLLPIYNFVRIEKAAERFSDADIVGYSAYVWNFENSIAIAKEVKRQNPKVVNIFGGPHIPDGKKQFQRIKISDPILVNFERKRITLTQEFHNKYPFIDMACHGEGEKVFKIVLEQMAIDGCYDKSGIPSISYVDANGIFHHNLKLARMTDKELAEVPSPYLNGVFDPLMRAHPEQDWIAMWETNRGCPYQCTYCDWGGAVEDRVSKFDLEQKHQETIWFGQKKIPYIFNADANYGILERDAEIARYLADTKSKYGYPEGISVQNTKNPKEHTIRALEILEKAGLNKATVMSQQSLNPATLKAVRRNNIKLDEYYEIQKRLAAKGVFTMTDLIFPMPEETYDSVADAISILISQGQHNRIQFNNLSILPNAEMGDPEYQEKYGMELVRVRIINVHGKRNDSRSGIEEWQDLAVATNTMPRADWRKTRVLCWMTNLLYFNKLLQIPIIILHEAYGVSYRQVFEFFSGNFSSPILSEINEFFANTAQDMQDGKQEEFVHSGEWLNIWWPPEEYIFIKLCVENKLLAFYEEAQKGFSLFLRQIGKNVPDDLLGETLELNRLLIKMPFQTEDTQIGLSYNIWDIYRKVLLGGRVQLEKNETRIYKIDRTSEKWLTWDDWYQKMVWWGNRRGAYLYGNKLAGAEIAGHY